MSKKANLKTCSFRHPSVSSYNIYPLLFAPKNKFFRALDFPRIFGQHPKNSAYHQNQQSERAWLFALQAWRSTIPDRSSKGGVLRLSKENFCMIRCHVDSLFHILHLQNAGNAESSAEKCSIHRTKFDENDPISSLIPDRSSKGGVLRLSKENFCMIRCHVDSLFHILHLQNAGNAESSAEKCSIHRTKFDENDPISSL